MLEDSFLQQFVTQQLQSGNYHSYEEKVQAGLCLRQEREAELNRIAEKRRPAAERYKPGVPGIPIQVRQAGVGPSQATSHAPLRARLTRKTQQRKVEPWAKVSVIAHHLDVSTANTLSQAIRLQILCTVTTEVMSGGCWEGHDVTKIGRIPRETETWGV